MLSPSEKLMRKLIPTHFTINYIYREYHLTAEDIKPSAPQDTKDKILRIYNPENVLGLVLAFYISMAISARKTAFILRQMFHINISHQTVLNYAEEAAYYCHKFNMVFKGEIDHTLAGDETYIKIKGNIHYLFLFMSTLRRTITAYHLADNRGPIPAIAAIKEAFRTAGEYQETTCVTDGNPAYTAALLFLNKYRKNKITHRKVIGLENHDKESAENREFKQLIERLNRTYKFHVRPAEGFGSFNGAMVLTTLFVTHYNFLRPHRSLGYKPPIHMHDLESKHDTLQTKWIKILRLAIGLSRT